MDTDTLKFIAASVATKLTDADRRPEYRGHPDLLRGQCYVAAEATYHLAGGRRAGLRPATVRHEGAVHWFLRTADGEVVDPTAPQFSSPVPYAQGRGRGFLTRRPSARARRVIARYTY